MGNTSSAFTPYAINTVQVGKEEKYLIVRGSNLNPTVGPEPLTKAWPLCHCCPHTAARGGCGSGVPKTVRRCLRCSLSHVRHQWSPLLWLLCQHIQGQSEQRLWLLFAHGCAVCDIALGLPAGGCGHAVWPCVVSIMNVQCRCWCWWNTVAQKLWPLH